VLIIGTCGVAGYAVIGADRVAGQPSRPSLLSPVIGMARCMLGCRHTVSKIYGPAATKAALASASGWGPAPGVSSTPSTSLAR
jgi:hypothetical protein